MNDFHAISRRAFATGMLSTAALMAGASESEASELERELDGVTGIDILKTSLSVSIVAFDVRQILVRWRNSHTEQIVIPSPWSMFSQLATTFTIAAAATGPDRILGYICGNVASKGLRFRSSIPAGAEKYCFINVNLSPWTHLDHAKGKLNEPWLLRSGHKLKLTVDLAWWQQSGTPDKKTWPVEISSPYVKFAGF